MKWVRHYYTGQKLSCHVSGQVAAGRQWETCLLGRLGRRLCGEERGSTAELAVLCEGRHGAIQGQNMGPLLREGTSESDQGGKEKGRESRWW